MTIDERLQRLRDSQEALAQSLELLSGSIGELTRAGAQDAVNIRALLRIAESRKRQADA